jgi:hypothetical protein
MLAPMQTEMGFVGICLLFSILCVILAFNKALFREMFIKNIEIDLK